MIHPLLSASALVSAPLLANALLPLGTLFVGLLLGAVAVFVATKLAAGSVMGRAKREADDLLAKTRTEGETLAKQMELDARNASAQRREAFDKETEATRNEIAEKDRRLTKREDLLDKKLDTLATKEKYLLDLDGKIKSEQSAIDGKLDEAEALLDQRRKANEQHQEHLKNELLRIAHLSEEDAKREAMTVLEQQLTHESGELIKQVQQRTEDEAKEIAQKITLTAIQRYASEHCAESTSNSVPVEDDAMKGRIIGREGRNIRAFEAATGVDVVVDDTPGVVIVSCFDPVRRAAAAETLRRLLEDGRIHPARIEELSQQVFEEFEKKIVKFGKDACEEAHLHGIHPKISEMMGRLHYRTSYGQNILRHSHEVAYLCQVIADELGLDGEIARRCGFLHDIGKAMDHEVEGGHPKIGADFCRKYGEKEAVLNAVEGHHNDIPSTTPYTPIVMAADAISGARTGARRESLERYVKRLQDLEQIAKDEKGVREAFAIQAGREVRVVVDPKGVHDEACHAIARNIAKRVSEEMTFPGEIKVTVLREMRTIEYAR
ncbi:MAG: ribonuclease Y [Planctomycetota bacterium]